jgi:hypothetical protein
MACSLREYCPELWKNTSAKRSPRKENAERHILTTPSKKPTISNYKAGTASGSPSQINRPLLGKKCPGNPSNPSNFIPIPSNIWGSRSGVIEVAENADVLIWEDKALRAVTDVLVQNS